MEVKYTNQLTIIEKIGHIFRQCSPRKLSIKILGTLLQAGRCPLTIQTGCQRNDRIEQLFTLAPVRWRQLSHVNCFNRTST